MGKFKIEMKVVDVVGLDLSVPTPTTVSSIVMTYDKKIVKTVQCVASMMVLGVDLLDSAYPH